MRKLEIPQSEFCSISGNWDKIGIPNLAGMFLVKYYLILWKARGSAFTVSELLKKNQQWLNIVPTHPHTQFKFNITKKLKYKTSSWKIKIIFGMIFEYERNLIVLRQKKSC